MCVREREREREIVRGRKIVRGGERERDRGSPLVNPRLQEAQAPDKVVIKRAQRLQ